VQRTTLRSPGRVSAVSLSRNASYSDRAFSALSRYYSLRGNNIPDEINAGAEDRFRAPRVSATLNCEWCTHSHAAAFVSAISDARGQALSDHGRRNEWE
jgi:hypothetical protein